MVSNVICTVIFSNKLQSLEEHEIKVPFSLNLAIREIVPDIVKLNQQVFLGNYRRGRAVMQRRVLPVCSCLDIYHLVLPTYPKRYSSCWVQFPRLHAR